MIWSAKKEVSSTQASPAIADVTRDQIEMVREIRRLVLHMQASNTA